MYEPEKIPNIIELLKARIEQLEKENKELRTLITKMFHRKYSKKKKWWNIFAILF